MLVSVNYVELSKKKNAEERNLRFSLNLINQKTKENKTRQKKTTITMQQTSKWQTNWPYLQLVRDFL